MVSLKKTFHKSKQLIKEIFAVLTIADKILILFLIGTCIFLQFFLLNNSQSTQAEIVYKGELMGKYDLYKEKKIFIEEGITVEIKNGKARLLEDTSPRQIGVKQGWSNQIPIISVPSELIIRFSNEKEEMLITY